MSVVVPTANRFQGESFSFVASSRRGSSHAMRAEIRRRITDADPYFRMISKGWSEALRNAYRAIPRLEWMG